MLVVVSSLLRLKGCFALGMELLLIIEALDSSLKGGEGLVLVLGLGLGLGSESIGSVSARDFSVSIGDPSVSG